MKVLLAILSILILLVSLGYLMHQMFVEGPHPWDFYDFDKDQDNKQN